MDASIFQTRSSVYIIGVLQYMTVGSNFLIIMEHTRQEVLDPLTSPLMTVLNECLHFLANWPSKNR